MGTTPLSLQLHLPEEGEVGLQDHQVLHLVWIQPRQTTGYQLLKMASTITGLSDYRFIGLILTVVQYENLWKCLHNVH